ncbi:tryptophan-rich sensory protein [Lysinibacillus sp. NPDC097287]|uniref:tryptophan-rich sensory protein n=1 Tax=Lysinibacillus sp. NPDC097287 TaxID=3364144 RepID=UPI00382B1657
MPQFIFVTITYIVALILTFSSYFIKINGQSSLEISNRFPVMFAPLNVSYVIWIVIFILLGYWLVMNLKNQRTQESLSLKQGILFGSVCILQMLMIIFWHLELFIASLIVTFMLLIYLFMLYNTYPLSNNKLTGRVPLSIYFAWTTFLLLTNLSFTLTSYEWNGFGLSNPLWAVILLTIGTAIALHVRFHHFDIAYPIVFIWAYIGIVLHNGFDELLVTTAALFLCGVLLVGILFIKKNPVYQK